MTRLTKKGVTPVDAIQTSTDIANMYHVYSKLSKLEDIEEELGIDLITLFNIYNRLCKQRYVYKKFTDTGEVVKVDLDEGYFVIDFKGKQIERIYDEPSNWYEFKDYAKTWAFTREELEK